MMAIRLVTRDGGHVEDVLIPPFQLLPEGIVWGERVFFFHREIKEDGEPCSAEYREGLLYVVPPPR